MQPTRSHLSADDYDAAEMPLHQARSKLRLLLNLVLAIPPDQRVELEVEPLLCTLAAIGVDLDRSWRRLTAIHKASSRRT